MWPSMAGAIAAVRALAPPAVDASGTAPHNELQQHHLQQLVSFERREPGGSALPLRAVRCSVRAAWNFNLAKWLTAACGAG